MATPSGGKIRSKRSNNTRKPYERPRAKSLLSRVSDTVKDFITPSWLNNLWTNPNDDDGEGSSRSSTPELPPHPNQIAVDTPGAMPAAVATSTPDVDLPRGKEALCAPHGTRRVTAATPSVQSDDVIRGNAAKDPDMDDDDDDVIALDENRPGTSAVDENRPSTSAGVRHHTPLPFRNYADPIGTSTPNEDMGILGGRKAVLDKDDASDTSVSTSGCSSLVPHLDKMEHKEKLSKKNLDRLSEMGQSNLASSSLWTDVSGAGPSGLSASRPQQPIAGTKRPSFNTSYFGSPRLVGELRPKNASPFYPGKTQFGGSSSQRSSLKRGRTSPYEVHLPVKRNVRPKPAPVGRDAGLGATSSTAKKILDTLERMSTPLLDAKKIPLSPAASPYSFRPSSRLSSLRAGTSRVNEPPVSDLRVAHLASIAPNRQPPVATVIDVDQEERAGSSRHEASPTTTAPPTISTASSFRFGAPSSTSTPASSLGGVSSLDKAGGKMKSKGRSTLHYSSAPATDDVVEIPDLPQVSLPLPKQLPKFSFGAATQPDPLRSAPSQPPTTAAAKSSLGFPQPAGPSITTATSAKATTRGESPAAPPFQFSAPSSSSKPSPATATGSKSESASGSMQFTFSTPIIKQARSGPSSASEKSASTSTTFKFSMPRQAPYATSRPASGPPVEARKPTFSTPERTRRKGDGDDDDDDRVVCVDEGDDGDSSSSGGIKVAKELKTGSCLEAFGILSSKNGPIPSSSTMVQAHAAKVSSTAMDNGPLLLGSAKQRTGSNPLHNDSSSSKISNSLADKFRPPASSWECDACMIVNREEAAKCIACETPKPGKAKAAGGTNSSTGGVAPFGSDAKSSSNSLAARFAKQPDEWECDTCMIRNKDSVDRCVACSALRPGGVATAAVNAQPPASSPAPVAPGNSIADKFKAKAGEWECDTCMIRNKAATLKCVACETPKPGSQPSLSAPPASSFKFGNSEPLSNGAFKFGSSVSSASNSNTNNASSTNSSSSVAFKLPTGFSMGQGSESGKTDVNGPSGSSGFKLPTNFSLIKGSEGSAKPANQKVSPSTGSSSQKCDEMSSTKLEVKVPVGFKLGSASDSASASGGLQRGGDSTVGGFKFGQSNAVKTDSLSNSIAPSGGFKFGQKAATAEQSLLEKEGPPPNVNIFQSKTDADGPPAKKSGGAFGAVSENGREKSGTPPPAFQFGAAAATGKEPSLNPNATPFQPPASTGTSIPFGGGSALQGAKSAAEESKPSFAFGSTASNPSSAAPAPTGSFNFGGNKTATTAADAKPAFGSTFGTTNATVTSSSSQQPAASSFSFATGQTTSTGTPATFTFGQASSTQPAASTASAAPTIAFGAPSVKTTKTEENNKQASFSFGSQNKNNSQAPSGFSFGSSAATTATNAQTTPSFNFGAAASKAPTTTPSGGFSFASTNSASTPFTGSSAPAFGGFGAASSSGPTTASGPSFGAPAASTTPSSSSSSSSAPSFTFGASATATTKSSNPFGGGAQTGAATAPFGGGQTGSQAPAFGSSGAPSTGFGAPSSTGGVFGGGSTPAKSNPAFGSGTSSLTNNTAPAFGASSNSNPPPAFGSGSGAPSFGSASSNSSSGGFQFGKQQPASSFTFGASNSTPAAAPSAPQPSAAAGVFQFTGNQQNQAAPQAAPAVAPQPAGGGFNFTAGQQPSFDFGARAPQPGATPFQFQAAAGSTDGNPFSAAGTPGGQQNRKIKRAIRRTARR